MTLLKCVNDVELPYVVQLGYRHVSCAPTSNSPLQKCASSSIYMHECASAVLPVFHFVSSCSFLLSDPVQFIRLLDSGKGIGECAIPA
jgi:hypothetical protein